MSQELYYYSTGFDFRICARAWKVPGLSRNGPQARKRYPTKASSDPLLHTKLSELQSTPDNSNLLWKSNKVRVIGSSKQITGSIKQLSKKMRRECKYHTHLTGMDTEFELQADKKLKLTTKNWHGCFEINSVLRTSVQWYTVLFPTSQVLKTWFELSRVKLYRNNLNGNKNYFELPRVKLQ